MQKDVFNIADFEKYFQEIVGRIFDSLRPKGSNKNSKNTQTFPKKIAVAVSGGIDSMALLLLIKKLFVKETEIFCLTVDHNFRKNSKNDATFVADFCQKNSLKCVILKSDLTTQPKANIENSLREVRYSLLQKFCNENSIKHLFIAHHRQDLAENFLIRLFRGSGIDGLAAMNYQSKLENLNLIRPLLDFTKSDLGQYLNLNKTAWVEDESNEDEKYLRNQIRNFLATLKDKEVINHRISLASQAILQSKKILEKETAKQFPKIFKFNNLGYFIVDLAKFCQLESQQINLSVNSIANRYLALALMKISGKIYKPRLENLQKLCQIILSKKLNKAHTFYGCVLEKLNDKEILIYRQKSEIKEISATNFQENIIFDDRFLIKFDKDFLKENIDLNMRIGTLSPFKLNQIAKENSNLKKLKDPIKKIFYTIPILIKNDKIIAAPQINYFKQPITKSILKIKIKL